MSVEIREENTQVVYNPRSGASSVGQNPGAAIASELHRQLPRMPRHEFADVLEYPERLDRPNTIVIGGDGSTAEIAKRIPGVIIPLDGSTSGVIQKSLGFKRHAFEGAVPYTNRVIQRLLAGQYEITQIAQGEIHRARPYQEDTPLPFVFRAGLGTPGYRYMESMETLRDAPPKRLRVFAGLVRTLTATVNAPIFTVVHNATSYAVLDAQVYKTPFLHSRMIHTADISRDVLITMNASGHPSRTPQVLLDAFTIMILQKEPKSGGISTIPLSQGEPVYVHTQRGMPQALQIDGEKQSGSPVRIYGSADHGVVYRFASIANS